MIHLSKRQKFILLSLSLTLSFWLAQRILPTTAAVVASFLSTLLVTFFVLGFDLSFPEHLIFPIYPILLTFAFFLNTSHLIFGLPAQAGILQFALYLFAVYLLFLTINILNVATIRTVPLKKAALSTLYFSGLTIVFFNSKGLLVLQLPLSVFTLLYFALSFFLILPLIYTIQIGPKPKLLLPEVSVLSLLSAEVALAVSFLKVSPISMSVFLTGMLFLLISLMQHIVKKTLTKRILWEHAAVGVGLVLFFIVIST